MKRYQLIDIPRLADISRYEKAILKATDLLSELPEVRSVYQIGGISAPGISDIDMLVVFKDRKSCGFSLHERLTPEEKYLFVHQLYGVSEENFKKPLATAFFGGFRLLFGPDLLTQQVTTVSGIEELKRQVAYEFLLKMFMVMNVQKEYGMLKARAFLLEAHALKYDLGFLNIHSGKLHEAVKEVIDLRAKWFDESGVQERLMEVFEHTYDGIREVLEKGAEEGHIFLPEGNNLRSGNVSVRKADKVSMKRTGLILPSPFKGKKRFNFLHLFNRFKLKLPYNNAVVPESITQRFEFCNELIKYNQIHFPDFLPMVSSLKLNR